uniref:Protein eva-1-C n=1 Tax=Ceratitis capitata TaxID=7213 RepID=W8AL18_CERCA
MEPLCRLFLMPNTFLKWIAGNFVMLVLLLSIRDVFGGEKLALLSATLRTYQKAACDTDQVVISCPRGTSISIEFAQYNNFENKDGFSIEDLCPLDKSAKKVQSKAKHLLRGSTFGSPESKIATMHYISSQTTEMSTQTDTVITEEVENNALHMENTSNTNTKDDDSSESCMWPNALQYSLLQTVVEACQKKKHCKFNGAPHFYRLSAGGDAKNQSSTISTVNVDPCHKRRKIVEVAYKCRPYEFRSKVACHNDVAQLECNPYSRIAVYSASFGRTEYESIQCPQPQGVREETCQASYATETVMQICHGRRRCNLAADANTFGSPCQPNSRMYLKVVYTCVPKQVLKDRYESEVEGDETEEFDLGNEIYDDELNYKESEAIPKVYSNSTVTAARSNGTSFATPGSLNANNGNISFHLEVPDSGSINPVMTHSADLSLEDNQERLYLYLLIAGLIGVIVCIIIVTVHVWIQKRHTISSETQMSTIEGSANICEDTTIPNGFNDTISEIDAEIDIPATISVPSVSKNENYITYGPNNGLYAGLGSSNRTQNVSTLVLQGGATIPPAAIVDARQSPDIIGISSKSHVPVATSNTISYQTGVGGVLAPTIVIGGTSSTSLACGAGVPMSSLAQYATAPTIRASYIINPEGTLKRPPNLQTPPMTSSMPNSQYSAMSTLRRMKNTTNPPLLQQQLSYDGTAPRTLSTGVPVNSQFYYG